MASFAHFVGVRRPCRALRFILTATEAAIATQKPNGKLNTACYIGVGMNFKVGVLHLQLCEAQEPLGGSWGMLPRKKFENYML